MGIATDVDLEVTTLIEAFVTRTSTALCETLQPIAVVAIAIWVFVLGWRVLRGHSPDTFPTILMQVFRIALISTIALVGGHYQQLVIDSLTWIQNTFIEALSGYLSMGEVMDNVYQPFLETSREVYARAVTGFWPSVTFLLAAILIQGAGGFLLIVGLGFYLMAKICIALLVAVGPAFILCKIFPATERLTDTWLGNVLGYVMVNVFVVAAITMLSDFGAVYVQNIGENLEETNVLLAAGSLLVAVAALCVVMLNIRTLGVALTGGVDTRGIGALVVNTIHRGLLVAGRAGGSPAPATGGQITARGAPLLAGGAPRGGPPAFNAVARQRATQSSLSNPPRNS